MSRKVRTVPECCPECGSDDLFSGYFDADDLGVNDDTGEGTRWTTWCNQCGEEVIAR